MGCQSPSMCCCKTPPTATSEASVLIHVGASALEGSVYQSFLDSGKSSDCLGVPNNRRGLVFVVCKQGIQWLQLGCTIQQETMIEIYDAEELAKLLSVEESYGWPRPSSLRDELSTRCPKKSKDGTPNMHLS